MGRKRFFLELDAPRPTQASFGPMWWWWGWWLRRRSAARALARQPVARHPDGQAPISPVFSPFLYSGGFGAGLGGGLWPRPAPDGGVRPPTFRCCLGAGHALVWRTFPAVQTAITRLTTAGAGLRFGPDNLFSVTRNGGPLAPPMKILEHAQGKFVAVADGLEEPSRPPIPQRRQFLQVAWWWWVPGPAGCETGGLPGGA